VRRVAHPVQGFLAALGAVAVLSIMDAVMKHLVLVIGIFAVSVWRAVANLVLSSCLYLPRRRTWPSRRILWIHVSRSIVVTIMAVLFFWGIGRVPLAQAIALTFIAPLIAMVFAPLFLKERLAGRSIAGAIAAFAGVVVIVLGQARAQVAPDVLLGIAAILGSAVCYSGNILMMRWQALAAKPLEINFFQSVVVLILWLAALPLIGIPHWPQEQVSWVVVASMLSTSGGLLFAWAYARGEASYLAVTEYSAFLWASVLGWLVFSERVSSYTLAGAVLIVGGCLIAARRKQPLLPEIDVVA
jgi:drug/metabolite transporter (DMT)-like permease